jgi:ribonuclease VapC
MLAVIFQETGAEKLTDKLMDRAIISTVNLAGVQTKLRNKGFDPEQGWLAALELVSSVEPFTRQQAKIAGDLIAQSEPLGLSLGDRASLALAIDQKAPVYSTEQIWRKLQLSIPIHIIR